MRLTEIIDFLDRLQRVYDLSPGILAFLATNAMTKALGADPDKSPVNINRFVSYLTPTEKQEWERYKQSDLPASDWLYLGSHLLGNAARIKKLEENHVRNSRD
ncbi:MAG TPA: hypothetical protein V6D27_00955 [Vampirovibrionales bacterium]